MKIGRYRWLKFTLLVGKWVPAEFQPDQKVSQLMSKRHVILVYNCYVVLLCIHYIIYNGPQCTLDLLQCFGCSFQNSINILKNIIICSDHSSQRSTSDSAGYRCRILVLVKLYQNQEKAQVNGI